VNDLVAGLQIELRVLEVLLGLVLVLQAVLVPVLRDFSRKLSDVGERTARIEGKMEHYYPGDATPAPARGSEA
jgi:hypothetical protein